VIPRGTEAALAAGEPASIILFTDSVKYLERLNVQTRLLEARAAVAADKREEAAERVAAERAQLVEAVARAEAAATAAQRQLDAAAAEARRGREDTVQRMRERLESLRREVTASAAAQRAAGVGAVATVNAELAELQRLLTQYFAELSAARTALEAWLAELRTLAGSRADQIPPPPTFPEPPAQLRRYLEPGAVRLEVPTPPALPPLPAVSLPDLPPLPPVPRLEVPAVVVPPVPALPSSLSVEERNVSGGPLTINTFDQNVPGFSVTFLLLGMLLGVSMGLLDERDWGTFTRLHALPIAVSSVLVGKLASRFVVGVVQMLVLFAFGWLVFGISLGPQPWALALPIAGIVFAGTAFGLVVAAVATSREAVLPVGSIVIVTMAAVGGCWWPIDLEPRWMRSVALAFPTTWAMDAFNDLMIRRRTVEAAFVPTAVMSAYGVLYLLVGVALFRRRGAG